MEQARLALGSVGPTVIRCAEAEQALVGRRLSPTALGEAGRLVRAAVNSHGRHQGLGGVSPGGGGQHAVAPERVARWLDRPKGKRLLQSASTGKAGKGWLWGKGAARDAPFRHRHRPGLGPRRGRLRTGGRIHPPWRILRCPMDVMNRFSPMFLDTGRKMRLLPGPDADAATCFPPK